MPMEYYRSVAAGLKCRVPTLGRKVRVAATLEEDTAYLRIRLSVMSGPCVVQLSLTGIVTRPFHGVVWRFFNVTGS